MSCSSITSGCRSACDCKQNALSKMALALMTITALGLVISGTCALISPDLRPLWGWKIGLVLGSGVILGLMATAFGIATCCRKNSKPAEEVNVSQMTSYSNPENKQQKLHFLGKEKDLSGEQIGGLDDFALSYEGLYYRGKLLVGHYEGHDFLGYSKSGLIHGNCKILGKGEETESYIFCIPYENDKLKYEPKQRKLLEEQGFTSSWMHHFATIASGSLPSILNVDFAVLNGLAKVCNQLQGFEGDC